jgi:hypothetical protein
MGLSTGCRIPLAQAVAAAAVRCFGSTMGSFSFSMIGIKWSGCHSALHSRVGDWDGDKDKGAVPKICYLLSRPLLAAGITGYALAWDSGFRHAPCTRFWLLELAVLLQAGEERAVVVGSQSDANTNTGCSPPAPSPQWAAVAGPNGGRRP